MSRSSILHTSILLFISRNRRMSPGHDEDEDRGVGSTMGPTRRIILLALSLASAHSGAAPSAFIFGLGYVGSAVAQCLTNKGWQVYGTCTREEQLEAMTPAGAVGFLFDREGLSQTALDALYSCSHVLSTVPPFMEGTDPVLLDLEEEIGTLHEDGALKWLGYLSSTGVYGDHGGAWVDETTAPMPNLARTRARFAAEREWSSLWRDRRSPVHVFRLAGIYGPGRSALDTVRKYADDLSQCVVDDTTFISRVHVADIVAVLEASMAEPDPGLLINVADDRPATRYEVMAHAAQLAGLGLPRPEDFTVAAVNRGGGNKRVSNTAMRDILQRTQSKASVNGEAPPVPVQLKYPDYRAGLAEIAADSEDPFVLGLPERFRPELPIVETKEGESTSGRTIAEVQGTLEKRVASLENVIEMLASRVTMLERELAERSVKE